MNTNNRADIFESVRNAVESACGAPYAERSPDDALGLDSILRLTLLVELENVFGIEFDHDAIEPEIFESLASLTEFIGRHKKGGE